MKFAAFRNYSPDFDALDWSLVIIRLMVGAVFLSEGIQKFLFFEYQHQNT